MFQMKSNANANTNVNVLNESTTDTHFGNNNKMNSDIPATQLQGYTLYI